ncbi:helix-turn-helix domain-containing protein [Actinokineospora spheciospongiae]|uniref:helix-turn-helix domain-containing protein n=1 Tax=Actinokineospora spheciospongiae TaxID=909613 RepID=UPI000D715396|nr:helix-turn-helix transcriptional regulator [Actinokineospora spheciospongiae]PWW63349.1 helix-turn-helix protein [Actinokineospora spheciospongiae]
MGVLEQQWCPDPDRVTDEAGLVEQLDLLRRRAARGTGKARVGLSTLARRAGLPRSTVHTYVSGRAFPPVDALDRIVQALGVPPSGLRPWGEAWFRAAADLDRRRRGTR